MRITAFVKHLAVAALALGMAAGCASTQQAQATQQTQAGADEVCKGMSPEVRAAIQDAQAKVNKAFTMGAEWRDAYEMVQKAKRLGKKCQDLRALELARNAEAMAAASIEAQQAQAEPVAEPDVREKEPADITYTVSRGDTLWDISGSPVAYNNPYMWPLIYRANTDIIRDPDLIYPGETLTIETDPSAVAVEAAIHHAKHRGAWSLGPVEESDKRYLNEW